MAAKEIQIVCEHEPPTEPGVYLVRWHGQADTEAIYIDTAKRIWAFGGEEPIKLSDPPYNNPNHWYSAKLTGT